jgi:SnoaL-like domain
MTSRTVLEEWIKLFNQADAEGLAALYSEDAINHQVANEPVIGRAAILERFKQEFANAEMVCIVEAIHEAGDVSALEWRDPMGMRGCGFFTVKNEKIIFQRGYWDKLSFLKLYNLPIA